MHIFQRIRMPVAGIVLCAAVGLVDAATARTADLVAVFAVILVLALATVVRFGQDRTAVPLRGDLARWAAIRAAESGEDVARVVDRAVAAYRAGLTTDSTASRNR